MVPKAAEVRLRRGDRAVLEARVRAPTSEQRDVIRARIVLAAFEVATHKTRRRRLEFLDFMNDIVAAYPDTALHVVLDNLNTHKPKHDRWLKRHPNVRFHFTPTRASWLNQVEVWFSILQGKSLQGASFNSVAQLQEHIDAFIDAYNNHAVPFVWTKKLVKQRRFKNRRISNLSVQVLGYVDGKSVRLIERNSADPARFRGLARELIDAAPDI